MRPASPRSTCSRASTIGRHNEDEGPDRPLVLTVTDSYTEEEAGVLFELMRAGGFGTPAGVVRLALWRLAQHYDIPCRPELFRLSPSQTRKSGGKTETYRHGGR